jgi:hypothetical protein
MTVISLIDVITGEFEPRKQHICAPFAARQHALLVFWITTHEDPGAPAE